MDFGDSRIPQRVWDALYPEPNTGCLLWGGSVSPKGYGRVGKGGRKDGTTGVHIWMCTVAHGEKPTPKHMVLHSCDTPACSEPSHIRWGTAAENSADMVNRGRSTKQEKCVAGHPRTPENVYVSGGCKTCARKRAADRRLRVDDRF